MINLTSKGSFDRTEAMVRKIAEGNFYNSLNSYAARGKAALAAATPTDSGLAASSWTYEVKKGVGAEITWKNTNVENGFQVAIMLQYGHGTGTGGYVQGRDYINPAIQPIMDQIAEEVWREVTRG